jgi:hypothetical protein
VNSNLQMGKLKLEAETGGRCRRGLEPETQVGVREGSLANYTGGDKNLRARRAGWLAREEGGSRFGAGGDEKQRWVREDGGRRGRARPLSPPPARSRPHWPHEPAAPRRPGGLQPLT